MLDPVTVVRLMLGLLAALYLLIESMAARGTIGSPTVPVVAASALVVALWVVAPGFMASGSFTVALPVRQAGLAIGAAAVIGRYVSVRRQSPDRVTICARAASMPLLAAALVIASANWLLAVPAAVLLAIHVIRLVGASSDEAHPPSVPPRGS